MATGTSAALAFKPGVFDVYDAYEQLALDEAVLNLSAPDSLILRFYRWKGPVVTFGYGQPLAYARRAAQEKGLSCAALARRLTGGGVVFHDGDITFSVVFPWQRLCSPRLIYRNMHRGVHLGLKADGIPSRLWSGPASKSGSPLEKQCFSAPQAIDIVDGQGRKALGGALRRRGRRGLYQGSMRPEIFARPRDVLEAAITRGLELGWGRPAQSRMESAWIAAARVLVEKYKSDEWNNKR